MVSVKDVVDPSKVDTFPFDLRKRFLWRVSLPLMNWFEINRVM